jgi:hypothetical protein
MKDKTFWLRPEAYIREVIAEEKLKALKAERKRLMRKKKIIRKQNLMSLGAALNGDMTAEELAMIDGKLYVNKEAILVKPIVIQHIERLETDEELRKRKEEEERKAAAEKTAKKKPPPKGQVIADPLDEP